MRLSKAVFRKRSSARASPITSALVRVFATIAPPGPASSGPRTGNPLCCYCVRSFKYPFQGLLSPRRVAARRQRPGGRFQGPRRRPSGFARKRERVTGESLRARGQEQAPTPTIYETPLTHIEEFDRKVREARVQQWLSDHCQPSSSLDSGGSRAAKKKAHDQLLAKPEGE